MSVCLLPLLLFSQHRATQGPAQAAYQLWVYPYVCERQRQGDQGAGVGVGVGGDEENVMKKEEKGIPWRGRIHLSNRKKKLHHILPCLNYQPDINFDLSLVLFRITKNILNCKRDV